jgi:aconitate hydratase
MGVLPLQFKEGQDAQSIGLDGTEIFSIAGLASLQPHQEVSVQARKADGSDVTFSVLARIDSPVELKYWQNGGILHSVLRDMIRN